MNGPGNAPPPVQIPEFVTPAPFDPQSRGDCILRSSDGHDFRVSTYILSLASSVFADMFTFPQSPAQTPAPALPIISMSEDSPTLLTLLLLIYPPGSGKAPPLEYPRLQNVVFAHDKYNIPLIRVGAECRGLWKSAEQLSLHGLKMYALAWNLGLEEEAKIASRWTHQVGLADVTLMDEVVRLAGGSVACVLALTELRVERERALDSIMGALCLTRFLCDQHGGLVNYASFKVEAQASKEYFLQVKRIKEITLWALSGSHPAIDDLGDFGLSEPFALQDDDTFCNECRYDQFGDRSEVHEMVYRLLEDFPMQIKFFIRK